MVKQKIYIFLLITTFFILATSFFISNKEVIDEKSWEYQLNEMNYLIVRTSSINIIYGLNLTKSQVSGLKELSKKIEELKIVLPDTKGNCYNDFKEIRKTYLVLIEYLRNHTLVPDSLRNKVNNLRILESDIIKMTVLGVDNQPKTNNECVKCHATPQYFPKGSISKLDTEPISDKERQEIDYAHVKGLYGDKGVEKLWELKSDVDKILTSGQKYILKKFRCCLLPPADLSNPANIGQATSSAEWINFFIKARKLSEKDWEDYKALFFIPIKDLIEAKLPGIKTKNKKQILTNVEQLTNEARKMDDVDFELNKTLLTTKMDEFFVLDYLIGENSRLENERQFIAAMFLLFPGTTEIYDALLTAEAQRH